MIAKPPFDIALPRRKSTWSPIPLVNMLPIESEHTWPVRSTSRAALIEINRSLRAMTRGSFTNSEERK